MLNTDELLNTMNYMKTKDIINLCKSTKRFSDICYNHKETVSKIFLRNMNFVVNKNDNSSIIFKFFYRISDEFVYDKINKEYKYDDYIGDMLIVIEQAILDVNRDILIFLLDNNLNKENLLFYCAKYNHLNIIKLLVKYNVNLRQETDMALYYASGSGNLDIVKYLIHSGLYEHIASSFDESYKNNHFETTKFLLEQDTMINDPEFRRFYFKSNMIKSLKYNLDIFKILVEYGIRYNFDMSFLNEILIDSAGDGNLNIVKTLIEYNHNYQLNLDLENAIIFSREQNERETLNYLKTHYSEDAESVNESGSESG